MHVQQLTQVVTIQVNAMHLQNQDKAEEFLVLKVSQAGKPIAGKISYVGRNRAALVQVGTDTAKELIFARLCRRKLNTFPIYS